MSASKLQDDKPKAEEIPERGAWANQFEFVLSCLNYAVGLGNVWRFPYLVYRNGGGAFLVPYIIMLFAMGLPIFFLELVIGQYSGLGPDKAFLRMAPIFQGLGFSTLTVISLITIYYQVIIGWTIFYIAASFTSDLPWGSCGHDFNTYQCFSGTENDRCISMSNETTGDLIYHNRICYPVQQICLENNLTFTNASYCFNETLREPVHIRHFLSRVLSSEEYYRDYALGINGATWESWGELRWQNVLCLLLSYIILYLCLMKGVQSSGKAAYFTAIFPYIVLIALLVRSVTLEGSYDGILFYVTPNWDALADASVWGDAASQTFYALGIGCGSLVTLASYSRFNNNCHRDAFFVSITNFLTSILAGFVVFAMLGFLAKELDVPIEDVVQSGPGLAFITYPEAVLHMPIAPLWSVLFFIMLFTLGIGCQFPGVEAVNSAIIDHWPKLRTKKHWVCACTISVFFLLGLPMSCSGGVYLFTLMDYNTASWAILIIGLAEIALVAWVYGYKRFLSNIAEMSMKFCLFTRGYWSITWAILSPLSILGVLFFILYSFEPASYEGVHFPEWVDALGWLIGVASVLPLPLFAMYHLVRGKYVGWELLQPSVLWGPPTGSTAVTTPLQVPDNNKDNANNGNYQSCIPNIIPNLSSSLETDLIKVASQETISKDNTYENLAFQSDNNIDRK